MKRIIFMWACLALIASTPVAATPLTDSTQTKRKVLPDSTTKSTTKPPVDDKTVLKSIPHASLELKVITQNDLLKVKLVGADNQKLTWILYQDQGKPISRLATTTKIDEIKISMLKSGTYTLMIKDKEGRAVYDSFHKL